MYVSDITRVRTPFAPLEVMCKVYLHRWLTCRYYPHYSTDSLQATLSATSAGLITYQVVVMETTVSVCTQNFVYTSHNKKASFCAPALIRNTFALLQERISFYCSLRWKEFAASTVSIIYNMLIGITEGLRPISRSRNRWRGGS